METTELTDEVQTNRPWLYKKGQSGNPNGRPKGSRSLKSYIKSKFAVMTDDEFEEYLDGIDKKVVWEMAEGKPKQDIDMKAQLTISDVLDQIANESEESKRQTVEDQQSLQDQEQSGTTD